MSEWFKEHAWKACKGASSSQVRILFLPPEANFKKRAKGLFFEVVGRYSERNSRCYFCTSYFEGIYPLKMH